MRKFAISSPEAAGGRGLGDCEGGVVEGFVGLGDCEGGVEEGFVVVEGLVGLEDE